MPARPTPTYPGVYVEEPLGTSHVIYGVTTSNTAFVDVFPKGPVDEPVKVTNFGEFEATFGPLDRRSRASYGIYQFFQNGGRVAFVVRIAGKDADTMGGPAALGHPADPDASPPVPATGIYTLADITPEVFNVLCLPVMAGFTTAEWVKAYTAAYEFCERQLAFLIADPPVAAVGSTTENAKLTEIVRWWESGVGGATDHGAVYFPRIEIADPASSTGTPMSTETSGTLAGIYARTDADRGVWKAPAGQEAVLSNVLRTEVRLTDEQNDTLNPLGINCLRTFPNVGTISWGARTIAGADSVGSEWKYVPVRRVALYIEQSLQQGTQFAVFEPNDEPLWALLRLAVGGFMDTLFREGAFAGETATDAYFVRCDGTTTTPGDQADGRVNVVVGFAPRRPAEFVVITITQFTDR